MLVGLVVGSAAAASCALLAWSAAAWPARCIGAFARDLAEALAQAQSDPERVALVDELLADFERRLGERAHWPRAAFWIAAAAGLGASIAELAARHVGDALFAVAAAAAGAIAALSAERAIAQRTKAALARADALVDAHAPGLSERAVARPLRRSAQVKRRGKKHG